MSKRLQGLIVGAVVGALFVGGIAYAVTVVPPNSADRYYACVSTAGVVRSGTLRLNTPPARCRKADDTIRSWNAQGPPGPATSALFRAGKSTFQSYDAGPFLADGPYDPVFVKVALDTEEFDSGGAYDPSISTFTAPSDGSYSFGANVMTSATAPGSLELILAVNGHIHTRLDKKTQQGGDDWETLNGTSVLPLAAGDTVALWLFSTAPGTQIVSQTPTYGYRNVSFFGYRLAA